ncbi:hypothetical protein T10_13083 [Trichinella papuae]|uniref:Uncharacterized protein n=1 Tax=Trichinella papuae TaxID=268474 RepID=A0A0V1MNT6_9BILA|nr:hypothetical protein T10_13083 [Trichinella papuae]
MVQDVMLNRLGNQLTGSEPRREGWKIHSKKSMTSCQPYNDVSDRRLIRCAKSRSNVNWRLLMISMRVPFAAVNCAMSELWSVHQEAHSILSLIDEERQRRRLPASGTALEGLLPELLVVIAKRKCLNSGGALTLACSARRLLSVMGWPIQGSESFFKIFGPLFKRLSSVAAMPYVGIRVGYKYHLNVQRERLQEEFMQEK